ASLPASSTFFELKHLMMRTGMSAVQVGRIVLVLRVEAPHDAGKDARGPRERSRSTKKKALRQSRSASLPALTPRRREKVWLGGRLKLRAGLAVDSDGPRLAGFRNLTHQLDMQQAIDQLGAGDLHIVGQLELALEGARADAAMQVLRLLLVAGLDAAAHGKPI